MKISGKPQGWNHQYDAFIILEKKIDNDHVSKNIIRKSGDTIIKISIRSMIIQQFNMEGSNFVRDQKSGTKIPWAEIHVTL